MTPEAEGRDFRGMLASGLTRPDLKEISARLHNLHELKREFPAVSRAGAPPGIAWVKPEPHCEVTFTEETPRGYSRAAA